MKPQCERKKVYIVVVTWNQFALAVQCVRSLMTLQYPHWQVVVVDNGSQDGTVERLRKEFGEQIAIISNPENLGYTGGNNVGIRFALSQGASYVMLLNDDTVVNDPDLVSKLVTVAESDSSIGLLSPSIYYLDAPDKVWYAGGRLSLWTGWKEHLEVPSDRNPIDTGYASGCCVLARASFIRQAGMLPEAYFFGFEDFEWSLRARRAGWRVVYVPDGFLLHKAHATMGDRQGSGVFSPAHVYYEHRNMIWLIRQYGNAIQRYLVWPILFMRLWMYKLSGYILLRRWLKFRALLAAIRDGLFSSPKAGANDLRLCREDLWRK